MDVLCKFEPFGVTYTDTVTQNNNYNYSLTHNPLNTSSNEEHELFFVENVVVWSSGGRIIKSFTQQYTVKQVKWCGFNTINGNRERFICVLHTEGVILYHQDGRQYSVVLPCKISQIWPTDQGLLLERIVDPEEESSASSAPTIFSLLHPLEELKPASYQQGELISNPNQKIAFSSVESSVVVIFDSTSRTHSFWVVETNPDAPQNFLHAISMYTIPRAIP